MSSGSSKQHILQPKPVVAGDQRGWGVIVAILVGALAFLVPQLVFGILVGILSVDTEKASTQFAYVLAVEAMTIGVIAWFMKSRGVRPTEFLRLQRFRFIHLAYVLTAFLVYFGLLMVVIGIGQQIGLDTGKEQAIGFSKRSTGLDLTMAFVSLVVLPPLAEEILMRGFLFGSLRKHASFIVSTLVVSAVFGFLHLFGGYSGGGLLWAAALDTLVLSLVLCYLRERTDSLWPCILLHALKNFMAFLFLFVFNA